MTTFVYHCFTTVLHYTIMATVKIVLLKHQQKEDKTWNVKIRITHDRQSAYISTQHYVGKEYITNRGGKFELRVNNNPVYDVLMSDVLRIRAEIARLGHSLNSFTAKSLCVHMEKMLSGYFTKEIHFFEFAYSHFDKMLSNGRTIGAVHRSRINKFSKFTGKSVDLFTDITSGVIVKYEKYLREEGLSEVSIIDYISVIKNVFDVAKDQYNDEDAEVIKIPNDPFAKYKYPKKPVSRKKALSKKQILSIMNYETNLKGLQIARDAFVISFLLCGINSADLYYVKEENGRVEYERRKTSGRRADSAFISIKIEKELLSYIERYKDSERLFSFYKRNSSHQRFNAAVNEHLKIIGESLGIDSLTYYAARHSWATIARNECGISMDDVAFCLNHKSGHDVTDTYIKKDWSIIDRANRKVLDFVFGDKEKAGG